MRKREEDEVRDGAVINSVFIPGAKQILGLDKANTNEKAKQGTGQIYTFNKLGFIGVNDKQDGWYLPEDKSKVAIVFDFVYSCWSFTDKVYLNNFKNKKRGCKEI